MYNYIISCSRNEIDRKYEWSNSDDAEIIRLLKKLIEMSRAKEILTIDYDSISARRQWEDGEHETIINVFYEENQIVFFTAVYNCVTFNFDYVSDVIPA